MKIWLENLRPDLKLNEERIRGVAIKLLEENGMDNVEVSLVFVDDAVIRKLNRRFLKRDAPTDVLSFNMREGEDSQFSGSSLGDVYISLERARQQADDYGVPFEEEVLRLVVHGLLHLLGLDHREEEEATNMKEVEEHYLRWAMEIWPSLSGSSRRRWPHG